MIPILRNGRQGCGGGTVAGLGGAGARDEFREEKGAQTVEGLYHSGWAFTLRRMGTHGDFGWTWWILQPYRSSGCRVESRLQGVEVRVPASGPEIRHRVGEITVVAWPLHV